MYHPQKSAWAETRPKKNAAYYTELLKKYEEYTKGNELLTIPEAFNAVNAKSISLLTADIKKSEFNWCQQGDHGRSP